MNVGGERHIVEMIREEKKKEVEVTGVRRGK